MTREEARPKLLDIQESLTTPQTTQRDLHEALEVAVAALSAAEEVDDAALERAMRAWNKAALESNGDAPFPVADCMRAALEAARRTP